MTDILYIKIPFAKKFVKTIFLDMPKSNFRVLHFSERYVPNVSTSLPSSKYASKIICDTSVVMVMRLPNRRSTTH